MAASILQKWVYDYPPQLVWDFLTRPDLLALWLMENDFLPVVGHEFKFRTRPLPNFEFDGNIFCRVLEVIPYKKLSYTWQGGPGNGIINLDTVVVWTLTEVDRGTELQIEQSGFRDPDNLPIWTAMNEGWLKNIKKIGQLLKTPEDDRNT